MNTMKKTARYPMFILIFVICSMMTCPVAFVQAQTTVHVYSGDSIQNAIDVLANPGDTILVHPGIYIGTVDIDKPVILRSDRGPRVTTIDGDSTDNTLIIRSNDVQVIGFTITHAGQAELPTPSGSGIYVLGDRCVIQGNLITVNAVHGIRLEEVEQARIVGNLIHENMGGIGGYGCEQSRVTGNTIQGGYDGIWWSACHDNEIRWNRISDHERFGMYVWGSNRNLIAGNRVVRSGQSGIETSVSYDNTIKYNYVFENNVYDLKTDDPSNNVWINNEYRSKNW